MDLERFVPGSVPTLSLNCMSAREAGTYDFRDQRLAPVKLLERRNATGFRKIPFRRDQP
jgi:hypothetical protein